MTYVCMCVRNINISRKVFLFLTSLVADHHSPTVRPRQAVSWINFYLGISIWVCPLPPVPAILKINQNNGSSVDLWLHNFRRTHIST